MVWIGGGIGRSTKLLRIKRIAGLIALFLLPVRGIPLGLGEIELYSALNEPLDAEVSLLDVDRMSLDDIVVQLASASEFERLDIERPFFLTRLQMTVEAQGRNGQPVVRLRSQQPVKEPFVDMLLSLAWPEGRIVREYTLLLDPPVLTEERAAPVATPATVGRPSVAADTRPAAAREAAVTATTPAPVTDDGGLRYGPVKRTDTLWSVAERIRGDRSLTIPQVMLALLRENPEAFYHGNVNELKAGYVLRISDPATLSAVAPAAAEAEVRRQYREWLRGKQRRGGQTATTSGKARPGPTGRTAGAGGDAEPRLKLVAPPKSVAVATAGAGGTGAATPSGGEDDIRQQLLSALEAADVAQQENQALRQRLDLLEKQLVDMRRLITLKADALAAMQAAAGARESVTDVGPSVDRPAAESEVASPSDSGSVDRAPASVAEVETVVPAPVPEDEPQPASLGFLDELLQPLWLGGAALLLVALLLGMRLLRRRRDGDDEADAGRMVDAAEEASVEAAASQDGEPEAQSSSVTAESLLDAMQGDEAAAADEVVASPFGEDEEEIDTLSEADVYLAYRRFDKAEQLLLEALRGEPERRDLALKLLETYAMSGNAEAFQLRAEALRAVLTSEESETVWPRVRELGLPLLGADHALFSPDAQATAAEPTEDSVPSTDADEESAVVVEDEAVSVPEGEPVPESESGGATTSPDLDVPLEFSLSGIGEEAGDGAATGSATTAEPPHEEVGSGTAPSEPSIEGADSGVSEDDLSWLNDMVEEDLGGILSDEGRIQPAESSDSAAIETDGISGEDSVATQLDLARAFIDMGDTKSAREILERLDASGDGERSQEIKGLLKQIA